MVFIGLTAVSSAKAAPQNSDTGTREVPILFGQTQSGSLDEDEINNFSFVAAAGDRVVIRLSRTSGLLDYAIDLYGPDGKKLGEGLSGATADLVSEMFRNSGTYRIQVSSRSGVGQGNYNLTLERLNPGTGALINFGQAVSGTLGLGDLNSYTFSASSGHRVIIRMSRTSASLNPEIRLYGPDGKEIMEAWSAGTTELLSDALPATGIYTLLAADRWGTNQGGYNLVLERLNPGSGPQMTFGRRVAGVLMEGDLKAYTFAASSGDRIVIRMNQTSTAAALYPYLRLFDPEGKKLQEEWSSSELEIRTDALPNAGTYTVLACDYYGNYAGEYQLIVERLGLVHEASRN